MIRRRPTVFASSLIEIRTIADPHDHDKGSQDSVVSTSPSPLWTTSSPELAPQKSPFIDLSRLATSILEPTISPRAIFGAGPAPLPSDAAGYVLAAVLAGLLLYHYYRPLRAREIRGGAPPPASILEVPAPA